MAQWARVTNVRMRENQSTTVLCMLYSGAMHTDNNGIVY